MHPVRADEKLNQVASEVERRRNGYSERITERGGADIKKVRLRIAPR